MARSRSFVDPRIVCALSEAAARVSAMPKEQGLDDAAQAPLKHGLVLPPDIVGEDAAAMIEYAVAAEDAGWDGVFMWDVLVSPAPPDDRGRAGDPEPWHPEAFEPVIDPVITLAGIAARTERIALGTWIIPLPRRHPWQVARDLATLDRLSGGRVILGAGLGRRSEYDLFGTEWHPATIAGRFDEALELVDRFWSGSPVTFHGEHFSVDGVAVLPTPVQRPRIPILIAGFWPNRKPLKRAARWDGYMPVVSPDPDGDLRELCAAYRDLAGEPAHLFIYGSPDEVTPERVQAYRELGVTWFGSYCLDAGKGRAGNLEEIRRGPPPR